jgi:hypothetical protein
MNAWYLRNRAKHLANNTARRLSDPEAAKKRWRAYALRVPKPPQHGRPEHVLRRSLTVEEYDNMLARQGGVCWICRRKEGRLRNGVPQFLAIDHDHNTGRIRGLLCGACNRGLGCYHDNVKWLKNAIRYLETQ